MSVVPIVIPAFEPDERMIELLKTLSEGNLGPVVIVNDGSGEKYNKIFNKAAELIKEDGHIISYDINHGKGYALKTAFRYILDKYPGTIGVITADSDGQHSSECIEKVKKALLVHPNELILGVRKFNKKDIPWKSWAGNTITIKVFQLATGVYVSDTQTGLRGIPVKFLRELIDVPGDRFEFETKMLIECAGKYSIDEVPIKTIYDSKDHHQSHFDPIKDSFKIYKLLLEKFFRYILSSLSSSILDLGMFQIFCSLLKKFTINYVILATVFARLISATYNYLMNYKFVFKSKETIASSAIKYFILATIQMSLSALLVNGGIKLVHTVPEVVVKLIVDSCLFVISYYVQKIFIFKKKRKE